MRQRLLIILAGTMIALGQEEGRMKLTAREIFYGAKPPETAVKAKASGSASAKKSAPKGNVEVAKGSAPANAGGSGGSGETFPARLAADVTSNPGGLAMRWSIVQIFPDGTKKEVPTSTKFKNGDRINVRVEVNDFGYLYIFAKGTSGTWTPLFPNAGVANGDNRVGPNQPYLIPSKQAFEFYADPGDERLFVVFSRKPEPDFDGLIYKVAPDRGDTKVATPHVEAPTPARPQQHPGIILAQNTMVGDSLFDRTRRVYARDLKVVSVEGNRNPRWGQSLNTPPMWRRKTRTIRACLRKCP